MIRVQGVTKRWGDFTALDDVSLEVPEGSLTALLGPSGSGKSTLLRVVAGLEVPDEGGVDIAGEDATGVPPQRRGIGFVFQHYAAFKHMTVRQNVAFGLSVRRRPKRETDERVGELLRIVGLEGYRDRYQAIADQVTELEPVMRDDVLGRIGLVELLTEPVVRLADYWKQ